MKRLSMALGGALAIAACGGSNMSPTASQLSTYRQAALTASDAVTAYNTAATTIATPADCAAATQQYETQMQQAVQQMQPLSGAMDDGMMSVGEGASADVACGVGVMEQEMARQRTAACASPDMAQNQAQIQLHCQTMQQLADHLQMRADEMDQMRQRTMGGGGMMGGAAAAGGTTDAGTGAAVGGSWQGPGGEMMSWDHQIPGCTATPTAPAPVTPAATTTSPGAAG